MTTLLNPDERLDDLQVNGLQIIQNSKWFSFGIDAVLLANFTGIKKGDRVADLGTGTGIIPLLLVAKSPVGHVTGIELQPQVAAMAQRSVAHNHLQDRITIDQADIKSVPSHYPKGAFDVVTSNPPYFKAQAGIKNDTDYKTLSRHEVACSLEDLFSAAYHLLKPHGRFYMVHRPDRLVDIVEVARRLRLEPKVVRLVQPKAGQKPNIMLMKFVKFGNHELKFENPLVVYNEDGTYTQAIYDIYSKTQITAFTQKESPC